jgi:hypothetical protein
LRALPVRFCGWAGIFLSLDEGARLALEPAVLALAHGVERFAEVTKGVELVEQNGRPRGAFQSRRSSSAMSLIVAELQRRPT